MDQKRPQGRDKYKTDSSTGVHKRGEGLGTGPVGSADGYSGRTEAGGGGGTGKRALGGGGLVAVIAIVFMLLKGGGLSSLLGGGAAEDTSGSTVAEQSYGTTGAATATAGTGAGTGSAAVSSAASTSYSQVNRTVAAGSRAKRTQLLGNGRDTVTLMVYMCGTDLESQNGMASADLQEMAAAKFGDNVNLIVYTGGCKKWQTQGISNSTNQIYQVVSGGIRRLVESDGQKAMTDPDTLSAFITWAAKNYPASRYELIFWDHGGGSVSGYGYDEKFARNGSMNLAGINKALKAGGVQFDFIGFDACLMATAETALMLNEHADYMIASEETEPGIGWYYTNWLTALGSNTSLSTLDIGQNIIDDFVDQCNKRCRGQKTTLSIIDLAEFANTVPQPLSSFSKSVSSLISTQNYQTVSDARYRTREFAASSKIDQIDLVDLCERVNTSEGKALSRALQGAVKYNRTSTNMTNAYGVSIYFPYQSASNVDKICQTYTAIGMDGDYAEAIRAFAKMETSGQVAAGGTGSPVQSLFGLGGGGSTSDSAELIGQLLGSFLGGGGGSLISGLASTGFMSDRALSTQDAASYISMNHFDAGILVWDEEADGTASITIPASQWDLIHDIDRNMFYDDGGGYIDLGWDNTFSTRGDTLIADTDRDWLAINGHPVAYYRMDDTDVGDERITTGRVPALLNGTRVNLWIVFDGEHPRGYIAGAQTDYQGKETETVAKNLTELKVGDRLDFICDYYSYSHKYQDSYLLGEPLTVTNNMEISNAPVGSGAVRLMYRFTDIYNQAYWSNSLTR